MTSLVRQLQSSKFGAFVPLLHLIGGVVIIFLVPEIVSDQYHLFSLTLGLVYLFCVLGLNVTMSSGVVSMGSAAFLLLGAYTTVLLSTKTGLSPLLGMALSAAICATAGAILALPVLRLGPFAVAVITLLYLDVISGFVLQYPGFTGGGDGLNAAPATISITRMWIYIGLGVLVFHVICRNLLKGPMGRALLITRKSIEVAGSIGVRSSTYRIAGFSMYAALCGIAGGAYQQLNGGISLGTFTVDDSVTLLLMAVLGGVGSIFGPALGVLVLTLIPLIQGDTGGQGTVREIIYGAVLLIVVLVFPKGLAGVASQVAGLPIVRERLHRDGTTKAIPADLAALSRLLSSQERAEGAELVVTDLRRSIGGIAILKGVSMTVPAGTVMGLIGPNGSGKTTMLNSINGTSPVNSGEVKLGGAALGSSAHVRANAGIGRTFQTAQLIDQATVRENLTLGLDASRKATHVGYALCSPRAIREARDVRGACDAWLAALGLAARSEEYASALTPRERRLLEVGRALAAHPRLLLLDEPVAGLTGDEIIELVEIIRRIRDAKITTVLVEHHAELVMELSDNVTVLDAGRVIASDTPTTVSQDPRVIAAYLGDELVSLGEEQGQAHLGTATGSQSAPRSQIDDPTQLGVRA